MPEYTHECIGVLPHAAYGPAVDGCTEDATGMWAGNDEYVSQVNFCPYCGTKALIQLSSPSNWKPDARPTG